MLRCASAEHGSEPGLEDMQRAATIAAPEDTARDVLHNCGAHGAPAPASSVMYRVGSAPDPQSAVGQRLLHSHSGAPHYHQVPLSEPLLREERRGQRGWNSVPCSVAVLIAVTPVP